MARKTCPLCGAAYRAGTSHGPAVEECRLRGALRVAKRGLRLVRGQDRQQADIIAFNTLADIRRAERGK